MDSLEQQTWPSWGSCFLFLTLHDHKVDNTAKFREADLVAYPLFPEFGVLSKLLWSKNDYSECDVCPQVLFGAMDTRYNVLSNLGLWLEYHYSLNPGDN